MSVWILILTMHGPNSVALLKMEFWTQKSCEAVGAAWVKQNGSTFRQANFMCVKSDEGTK